MLKIINVAIIGLDIILGWLPIPFIGLRMTSAGCWASSSSLCESYSLIGVSCFGVATFFFLLSILEIKRGQPININLRNLFGIISIFFGIISLVTIFLK